MRHVAFYLLGVVIGYCAAWLYYADHPSAEPQPTPANERSLLVRPASASPEDQEIAKRANGDAPLWRAK